MTKQDDDAERRDLELVAVSDAAPSLFEATKRIVEGHVEELSGLLGSWRTVMPSRHDFVVADVVSGRPVGLVSWTGPDNAADPSWWIAEKGKGYGSTAVDLLAEEMKAEGVTAIRDDVAIDTYGGEYQGQSKRMLERLRSHFE